MATIDLSVIIDAPIINGDKCFFSRESYEKYSVAEAMAINGFHSENGHSNHVNELPDTKSPIPFILKQNYDLDKPEEINGSPIIQPLDLSDFDDPTDLKIDGQDSTAQNSSPKKKNKKKKKARIRNLQSRNYDSIPYHYLHPDGIEYINKLFMNRRFHVQNYPRYYMNKDVLPLMSVDDIPPKFVHLKTLHTLGQVNRILIPTKKQNILPISYSDIVSRYPVLQEKEDTKILHKQPVSRDTNAEYFAQKHSVNIVISTSALKTLVSSACPDDSYSWEIPIVVKEYTLKSCATKYRVVYVDKPFPRKQLTSREKSHWFYKSVIRCKFIHPHVKQPAKKRDSKSSNSKCPVTVKDSPESKKIVPDLKECTMNEIIPHDYENTSHHDVMDVTENEGNKKIVDTVENEGNNEAVGSNVDCANVVSESEHELIVIDARLDDVKTNATNPDDENVLNSDTNAITMLEKRDKIIQSNVEDMCESEQELVIELAAVNTTIKSPGTVSVVEPLASTSDENVPVENQLNNGLITEKENLKLADRCLQLKTNDKQSDSCYSDSDCLVIDMPNSSGVSDIESCNNKKSECPSNTASPVKDSNNNNSTVNDNTDNTNKNEFMESSTQKVEITITPSKRSPSKYKLPQPEKIMTRSRAAKLKLNSSTEEAATSDIEKSPDAGERKMNDDLSSDDSKQNNLAESTSPTGNHLLRDIFGSSSSDEEIPCKERNSVKRKKIPRKSLPKPTNEGMTTNSSNAVKSPLDEIFELQKKLLGDGQDRKTDEELDPLDDDKPQFLEPINNSSISYNLWKLGDIVVLTRCSIDGQTLKRKKKEAQQYTLSPKIEYQSDFGAEVMTQSEINREWISAFIRPGSQILRVRIQPFISKILSVEHINLSAYQRAKFTSATLLHLVFSRLKRLTAGNYLLTHQEKQAFCHLLENVEDGTKPGTYDLNKSFNTSQTVIENRDTIEWLPLDTTVKFNYCT